MPNKTEVVARVCPYRVAPFVAAIIYNMIEERFDFQIAEGGKIERVSLGVFDLVKEVDSHKDEVGLINVLKLAQAKGIDSDIFAKTEPGLMVDVPEIDTFDDLLKAKASADAKLKAIAGEYGLTTEQLINAVQSGNTDILKKEEPKVKEVIE